ncbi:centrosomal AT-AC splicing factor-like [Mercenaria mercenaria]|uniref:centrosomal AT-AC splicing factor-like n=1 Tax=Mercenaria mercenaria TaxID=6596 RepID=UPI00234E8C0E|nr:centrosomal AT-AC splicing factor-like [Mercenaria mercenaria]
MASKEEVTTFRQFSYCSLCKISHKLGKKHIYSKRHQLILKAITQKFSCKIQQIKKDLFSPNVQDATFENCAKFWCYFCKKEYAKHEIEENCTVVGAGLLEHISSKDHQSNMEQFFWDNLMKKELKPQFLLSLEDLHIFKKAAMLAVKKRQKSEELARTQIAEEISLQERKRLSESAVRATSLEDLPGNAHFGTSLGGSGKVVMLENRYQSAAGRKLTLSAKADGLTYVKPATPTNTEEGNVHSGAVPPWLQPDEDSSGTGVIGPTMQDFQKHLEREKKSKLPANRVGAKFDHTASTSHDWLPSFGRVWSKGRRLQSKQHFERELKKGNVFGKTKQKPSSTVSSYSQSTTDVSVTNQNQQSDAMSSSFHTSMNGTHQTDIPHSVKDINKVLFSPVVCNPYKRKQGVSEDTLSANQKQSCQKVTNQCVPYKRRRDQINHQSVDQIKLLHTPVLALDEWK